MTPREAAQAMAERLLRDLPAEEVWLFGSQARGDATPDSDVDVLAIVPDSTESRYRRAVTAHGLLADVHFPKDIIVLTRREWEKELKVPSSLSSTVMREGVRLSHAS
ncbi:MAG TPA: nucleotidyltransferase domain-containing protein [Chthoniobacterales bacterium]